MFRKTLKKLWGDKMANTMTELLEARAATQNLLSAFKPQAGEMDIDQIKGSLDTIIDAIGVLGKSVVDIRDALPGATTFRNSMQRAKIDPPSEFTPGDK